MTPHNQSSLPYVIIVALLAVGFCLYAVHFHNTMQAAMPPAVEVTQVQVTLMENHGIKLWPILGTGSMRPIIPVGKIDEIVAYAKRDESADFDSLKVGDLVIFRHKSGNYIIHQLAGKDNDGWITSGSNNGRFDSGRIARDNYIGRAEKIYTLKK